jgi:hypothetical protein
MAGIFRPQSFCALCRAVVAPNYAAVIESYQKAQDAIRQAKN